MSIKTLQCVLYSLDVIQEEARQLVYKGAVSRNQPIHTLCLHIPAREWVWLESDLEKYGFLLRDRIGDLLGNETWCED